MHGPLMTNLTINKISQEGNGVGRLLIAFNNLSAPFYCRLMFLAADVSLLVLASHYWSILLPVGFILFE